ncbi:MAG: hypothetical protein ACT4OX_11625 [Actinomycetota bacterium]
MAVLAQQYSVAPLSLELLGMGMLSGAALGVLLPSLLFTLAAWSQARQARRMFGTARPVRGWVAPAVSIVMFAIAMVGASTARPAAATATGPCVITVDDVDATMLVANPANAVVTDATETVEVVVASFTPITGGDMTVGYAGRDIAVHTIRRDVATARDPHTLRLVLRADEVQWIGAGLYQLAVRATLQGGPRCSAEFVLDVEADPLATAPGRASFVAMLLSVAGIGRSSVRASRAGRLAEMRDAFSSLNRARTWPEGLGNGAPWVTQARPPAAHHPPDPAVGANRKLWWKDTAEPQTDIGRGVDGAVATVAPAAAKPDVGLAQPTAARRPEPKPFAVREPFRPEAIAPPPPVLEPVADAVPEIEDVVAPIHPPAFGLDAALDWFAPPEPASEPELVDIAPPDGRAAFDPFDAPDAEAEPEPDAELHAEAELEADAELQPEPEPRFPLASSWSVDRRSTDRPDSEDGLDSSWLVSERAAASTPAPVEADDDDAPAAATPSRAAEVEPTTAPPVEFTIWIDSLSPVFLPPTVAPPTPEAQIAAPEVADERDVLDITAADASIGRREVDPFTDAVPPLTDADEPTTALLEPLDELDSDAPVAPESLVDDDGDLAASTDEFVAHDAIVDGPQVELTVVLETGPTNADASESDGELEVASIGEAASLDWPTVAVDAAGVSVAPVSVEWSTVSHEPDVAIVAELHTNAVAATIEPVADLVEPEHAFESADDDVDVEAAQIDVEVEAERDEPDRASTLEPEAGEDDTLELEALAALADEIADAAPAPEPVADDDVDVESDAAPEPVAADALTQLIAEVAPEIAASPVAPVVHIHYTPAPQADVVVHVHEAPAPPPETLPVRQLAVDGDGAGVLGPTATAHIGTEIGAASRAALARWSDASGPTVPDLESAFAETLEHLPISDESRRLLETALREDSLRDAVDHWVAQIGRPIAALRQAMAWHSFNAQQIITGLVVPSPNFADVTRRASLSSQSDHDWDLLIQEVQWPWREGYVRRKRSGGRRKGARGADELDELIEYGHAALLAPGTAPLSIQLDTALRVAGLHLRRAMIGTDTEDHVRWAVSLATVAAERSRDTTPAAVVVITARSAAILHDCAGRLARGEAAPIRETIISARQRLDRALQFCATSLDDAIAAIVIGTALLAHAPDEPDRHVVVTRAHALLAASADAARRAGQAELAEAAIALRGGRETVTVAPRVERERPRRRWFGRRSA